MLVLAGKGTWCLPPTTPAMLPTATKHFDEAAYIIRLLTMFLIAGVQCLDPRSVWLLMGHDGAFLEYSTCQGQSSGPGVWRSHLYKALGEN